MADIVVTRCCINHFSCGTGTFTPQLCLCSSSCSSNCSCKSEDMHGLLNHSSVGKACVGHEVCRHGISWLWVCVSQSRTRVRLSTTESFLPARYFRLLCSLILNYTVFLRHQKTQKTYKQHLNLFHSNWSIFFSLSLIIGVFVSLSLKKMGYFASSSSYFAAGLLVGAK